MAIAKQLGTTLFLSRPKAFMAECLLDLGEVESASLLAQEAVHLAQESGERHGNALGHRALAEALFRRDHFEQAESTLLTAIGIQEENGERPELARSFVVYAELLKARGENNRAQEMAARAVAMFKEMEMKWDRERAEGIL
jgi:hypothetical protein